MSQDTAAADPTVEDTEPSVSLLNDIAKSQEQAEAEAASKTPAEGYTNFSFLPEELELRLSEQGIETPTPIQQKTIIPAMAGRDIVAQSQTGSGKTLAFAIPVGLRLEGPSEHGFPRALILTPTRELATQVDQVFHKTLGALGLRCMLVIGGGSYHTQKKRLQRGVDIVVGTPGRIVDLIKQDKLRLDAIESYVLDEVDQMLDIGFAEELKAVRSALPEGVQTLFFSATMNKKMEDLAHSLVRKPVSVKIAPEQSSPKTIEHGYIPVKPQMEIPALLNALLFHGPEQALIFCATKEECREVTAALQNRGFNAAALNGDMQQAARNATMEQFRDKSIQYLVATNVAARGLDIQSLPLVINIDVPYDVESYTHRSGRTGRAGEDGRAWTIITPRNFRRYWSFMNELRIKPTRLEVPTHNEILKSVGIRELSNLTEFSDHPAERRIRRVVNQILEDIPQEMAMELLRGYLYQQMTQAQAHHTYHIAVEEGDLTAPRGRRFPRDDRPGRGGSGRRRDRRGGSRDSRGGGSSGGERRERSSGGGGGGERRERSGGGGGGGGERRERSGGDPRRDGRDRSSRNKGPGRGTGPSIKKSTPTPNS